MKLSCFETVELSDVGLKRKNNEDACLRIPEKGVYCVADGMGGVVGGHLASAAIVDRVKTIFANTPDAPENFLSHVNLFRQAAAAANKWIRDFAEERAIGQMGSTLVGIVFDPQNPRRAAALHAGDSRLYRFRDGELKLLTADHSAAAALAAQLGRDIASIPDKFHNELVKAVGLNDRVGLECNTVDVKTGDIFLLCSDGLTRMVLEPKIAAALNEFKDEPLIKSAQALIAAANEAGGKDNVSVVLIRMGDLAEFPETLEPVDLAEPIEEAPSKLDDEPLTASKLGGQHASDSSDYFGGDTPQTDDMGRIHPDTPQTEDPPGPRTPPTAMPPAIPKKIDEKPAAPAPEPVPAVTKKRGVPVGLIIAAVVALVAAGVIYSVFGPRTSEPPPTVSTPSPPVPPTTTAPPVPVPAPELGVVMVHSDPTEAEVWIGNELKGKTPLPLSLPAGPVKLILKTAGLPDQVASTNVVASRTNEIMVTFSYGNVVVRSQPAGAAVELNGTVVGYTPYMVNRVPPGKMNWRLTAAGWEPKNITVEVTDHQTAQTMFTLQKQRGVLQLTGNLPGILAKLDGAGVGALPSTLFVDPNVDHTVTAEYQGAEKTQTVRVEGGQTNTIEFDFNVGPPPAVRWTNSFGMSFVQVPGAKLWAADNRVTLDQFTKIMGQGYPDAKETEDDDQHYVVNLPGKLTTEFAEKMTEAAKSAGNFPEGAKDYHFAIPTTNQWMQVFNNAEPLGIPMLHLKKDKEWCLNSNSWFMAGYLLQGTNFNPEPGCHLITPPPGDSPRQFAIRLVLAP